MRLKQLRQSRGLTQAALAKELHVASNTLCNWENGKRTPDFDTLTKIADYFHVTTDYLIGSDENDIANIHQASFGNDLRDTLLPYYHKIWMKGAELGWVTQDELRQALQNLKFISEQKHSNNLYEALKHEAFRVIDIAIENRHTELLIEINKILMRFMDDLDTKIEVSRILSLI